MRHFMILAILVAATAAPAAGVERNSAAVQEVLDGKRIEANAGWWGFDAEDATESLQAAISSGAKKVVIPNLGSPWTVRPIRLASNQELVLEEGVTILAKRGEFRGRGDTLLSARDVANLTIRGNGAALRMQKEDYIVGIVLKDLKWERWFGPYEKAEWRSGLALRGCTNVKVLVLTIADSGGDGVYVDGGKQPFSKDIVLKDLVCDNNYRQGISVISVDGLLVEDCVVKNTWGTPPSAGVDIEPDKSEQKLVNLVFRNCRFEDNYGDGIEVFLPHLTPQSEPVSILFADCVVTSRRGPGIRVSKINTQGPRGLVEFRDCLVEHTEGYGIKVQDKAAESARVRFVRCTLRDVARNRSYRADWAPIWLHANHADKVADFGGIDFVECIVEDDLDRPAIAVSRNPGTTALRDVRGTISVANPHGVKTELTDAQEKSNLTVRELASP